MSCMSKLNITDFRLVSKQKTLHHQMLPVRVKLPMKIAWTAISAFASNIWMTETDGCRPNLKKPLATSKGMDVYIYMWHDAKCGDVRCRVLTRIDKLPIQKHENTPVNFWHSAK